MVHYQHIVLSPAELGAARGAHAKEVYKNLLTACTTQ